MAHARREFFEAKQNDLITIRMNRINGTVDSFLVLADSNLQEVASDDDSGGGQNDWTDQSDQGAFHAARIPFVYFGVEDHPDYHKPTDDPERIQPGFFYRAARTIAGFVERLDAAVAGWPAR